MERWQPEVVAIEEVFYSVNAKSALKLGQVRGVALLAAACQGLPVAEYAPLEHQIQRGGLRAGQKRAGPVHGGAAAGVGRIAASRPTPPMRWPSPSATFTPRRPLRTRGRDEDGFSSSGTGLADAAHVGPERPCLPCRFLQSRSHSFALDPDDSPRRKQPFSLRARQPSGPRKCILR